MKSTLILFLLFVVFASFGQDTIKGIEPPVVPNPIRQLVELPEIIVFDCESDAQFAGGVKALKQYFVESIDWSCIHFPDGFETSSKVYVSFVVNEKGEVENPEVERGINEEIDTYCLELIREMPKWTPALDCEKQPVKQKLMFPITICLD